MCNLYSMTKNVDAIWRLTEDELNGLVDLRIIRVEECNSSGSCITLPGRIEQIPRLVLTTHQSASSASAFASASASFSGIGRRSGWV